MTAFLSLGRRITGTFEDAGIRRFQFTEKLRVLLAKAIGQRSHEGRPGFDLALQCSLCNEEHVTDRLETLFTNLDPVVEFVDEQYTGAAVKNDCPFLVDRQSLREDLMLI